MDQGLKERLIGAAVLVALGVWLIPWVLDGSGPAEQTAAELELPAAEEARPMRTHTIDLSELRQTPASAADARAPARSAREAADAAPAPGAPSAPAPQAAKEGAEAVAATPAAEEEQSSAQSAPAAAEPEPPASTARAEPAPAKAEPAPRAETPRASSPAAEPAAASGDWMVQLGSFGEEENAKRLVERVRTFGYQARISNARTGGRVMYRVRVGPHATRRQAEAAASSLSAHGFVAQVVAAD